MEGATGMNKANIPYKLNRFINEVDVEGWKFEYGIEKSETFFLVTLKWTIRDEVLTKRSASIDKQVPRKVERATQTNELDFWCSQEQLSSPNNNLCEVANQSPLDLFPGKVLSSASGQKPDKCYLINAGGNTSDANNSGDEESTVSVSSLDSVEYNQRLNQSSASMRNINPEAFHRYKSPVEQDISIEQCSGSDRNNLVRNPCQHQQPSPTSTAELDAENNKKQVEIPVSLKDFAIKQNKATDSRKLSPIEELSDNPSNSDDDNTTCDETISDREESEKDCLETNFHKISQHKEQCISVGYVYLMPEGTQKMSCSKDADEETKRTFLRDEKMKTEEAGKDSNDENCVDVRETSRKEITTTESDQPRSNEKQTFTFGDVTEEKLCQLYRNKMRDLIVVRASKYRLKPDQFCDNISYSDVIDFRHIDDVYYDEVIMTRPSYVIQLKPKQYAIRKKFSESSEKTENLILSDGDLAKIMLPNPMLMDRKWRNMFNFEV
ncbi:uncharacterized protein LOC143459150 [Clavelina lepadiformis]|uniref:uncharacterized protein LOC143459150 n=1 Tax=Clavelina lepadiformis TaxID=159417 RepID=UPI004042447F